MLSPVVVNELQDILSTHAAELLELAIAEAVKANARSIKYIRGIFRNWDNTGVKTVESAKLAIAEHQNNVSIKKGKSENDRTKYTSNENQQKYGLHF